MHTMQPGNNLIIISKFYPWKDADLFELRFLALLRLGFKKRTTVTAPGQFTFTKLIGGYVLEYGKILEPRGQLNFLKNFS